VVDKVGGYMIGNILISVFAGTATFICLELVRVPFALPLAVTVAIADLIPMVGATLGAVVCVLVSLPTVDLWPKTVIVVLFFVVYQQVENYLVVPRVFRNTVDMPSVVVLREPQRQAWSRTAFQVVLDHSQEAIGERASSTRMPAAAPAFSVVKKPCRGRLMLGVLLPPLNLD
jgi:hypothetical protein